MAKNDNPAHGPVLLQNLIEGLKQAEGGCSQLIHAQRDMRWMIFRDLIEGVRKAATETATLDVMTMQKWGSHK